MIVLDTNVVSEAMKPEPHRGAVAWLSEQDDDRLHVTAITAAEMRMGAALVPPGRRARALASDIEAMLAEEFAGRILPFDDAASAHYADLFAARRRVGRRMSLMDALIAAIARSHGATLATRNTRDFDGCGLDLVNPFDAGGGGPRG